MKRFLVALLLSYPVVGMAMTSSINAPLSEQKIDIENRILLKVNGKVITMMDLVRKMDLLFYRQYPELADSAAARFQFYSVSWEPILQIVIDEELILADAEEKEIPLTDGEIRQEMEKLFGPRVVYTLDQLHLSFEEAFKLIKRELMVQKATSAFVHSWAVSEVGPAAIRAAYQKMIEAPPPGDIYSYQYITVKSEEDASCKAIAEELCLAMREGEEITTLLEKKNQEGDCTCLLSESFERTEDEIALAHLKELKRLQPGGCSEPIAQASKTKYFQYRIFVLQEREKGEHPSLREVEGQLKQQLLQQSYAFHNDKYRAKLRKHYDITEEYLASFTPQEFKPFALR